MIGVDQPVRIRASFISRQITISDTIPLYQRSHVLVTIADRDGHRARARALLIIFFWLFMHESPIYSLVEAGLLILDVMIRIRRRRRRLEWEWNKKIKYFKNVQIADDDFGHLWELFLRSAISFDTNETCDPNKRKSR